MNDSFDQCNDHCVRFRCLMVSYKITAAAVDTLSESFFPCIGMDICCSACSSRSAERPLSSAPTQIAIGRCRSVCAYTLGASG